MASCPPASVVGQGSATFHLPLPQAAVAAAAAVTSHPASLQALAEVGEVVPSLRSLATVEPLAAGTSLLHRQAMVAAVAVGTCRLTPALLLGAAAVAGEVTSCCLPAEAVARVVATSHLATLLRNLAMEVAVVALISSPETLLYWDLPPLLVLWRLSQEGAVVAVEVIWYLPVPGALVVVAVLVPLLVPAALIPREWWHERRQRHAHFQLPQRSTLVREACLCLCSHPLGPLQL